MSIEILNHLRNEHRNINGLLHILKRQLASIKVGDRPDYCLMYDIAQYLTYYPDRYHHPFEDMIFARLAELRPEFSTVVAGIERQHHQIAFGGSKLRDLIGEIIDGLIVSREILLHTGIGYINAYRVHMQNEEDNLFDILPVNLNAADWIVLNSAFHWQIDPVFSEEVSREYQHLRDCITAEGAGHWPWKEVLASSCPACSSK